MKNNYLQVLEWQDIKNRVEIVNPTLFHEIDKLNPGREFKVVYAKYSFGQHILLDGELQIPIKEQETIGINDPSMNDIKKLLFGNKQLANVPVGISLKNSIELYSKPRHRVAPFSIMHPGKLFALWSAFENEKSAHIGRIWNISAGARSIFLLPKISDLTSFWRLKKEFALDSELPKSSEDHWHLLKEIADKVKDSWEVEVIFFSHKWFDQNSSDWRLFKLYLMEVVWRSTSFVRDSVIFHQIFSSAQEAKKINPAPYLSDTIKHLYALGSSFYPGFVFADDDQLAPIKTFQKIFRTVYQLKYAPTIMHLDYLGRSEKSCYYSLQFPTLFESSPLSRKESTNIMTLHQIDTIMQKLLNYILDERPDLHQGPIYKWAYSIGHTYIHHNPKKFLDTITPTSLLPKIDNTLQKHRRKFSDLPFNESNIFMRGCVRAFRRIK